MAKKKSGTGREALRIWVVVILVLLAVGVLLLKFTDPPPPKKITLVTGSPAGAYFAYGKKYAEALEEKAGIEVEVKNTAGSVENIRLIEEGGGTVVGFVQGGIADAEKDPDLRALGSLYYEPLWVFYRSNRFVGEDEQLEDLRKLKGKKIAIGPEGSGTRAVALDLLMKNGIVDEEGKPVQPTTRLLPLKSGEARDQLLDNAPEIDAAFFIAGTDSQTVSDLLGAEGVELMTFKRYISYRRKLTYISTVELFEGMIDLARNVPSTDTTLLAPAATLMVHEETHPGIVELLTTAALRIHAKPGVLEKAGQFPSTDFVGNVPMHRTAERIIVDGPSLLSRYLPFWLVSLVRQLKILLIGMIPALLAVGKLAPMLFKMRMNRKVFGWYKRLREVEEDYAETKNALEAREKLAQIASEVAELNVPMSFWKDVYTLRVHIDFMKRYLREAGA